MSNRYSHEEASIKQVISFLKNTRGIDYQISGEHVQAGNKNCDYMLSSANGTNIAVEIVRLVNSPKDMEQHTRRSILWKALEKEFSKQGISDLDVQTPWSLSSTPREINQTIAPRVSIEAAAHIQNHPEASDFKIDGIHFHRLPQGEGILHSSVSEGQWTNFASSAEVILDIFRKKDSQLVLAATEKFLVAIPYGIDLDAAQITWELALRDDLDRIQYADLVLHVPTHGDVSVIYAKTVRDYFANRVPPPKDHAALIDTWLCARLSGHHENIFALVKAFHQTKGSLESLSIQTRAALGRHGVKLVEWGQYEDAMWILSQLYLDPHPPPEEADPDNSLTTVRGSIANLLSSIIRDANTSELAELLEFTRRFSTDANQEVRRIAAYSIRALMTRREFVKKDQKLPTEELRAAIRTTWMNYINSSNTQDLLSAAKLTLDSVHDITEEDAEFVVANLHRDQGEPYDEIFARFFIYFTFLRSSNPGMGKFEDAKLRNQAEQLLHNEAGLRRNVAFAFKNIAKDRFEIRSSLKPLLTMLLENSSDELSLLFTLDGATTLALDNLLSPADEESFLCAMNSAGPFNQHEAATLATSIHKLVKSLKAHRISINTKAIFDAIRDPNLQKSIHQHREDL